MHAGVFYCLAESCSAQRRSKANETDEAGTKGEKREREGTNPTKQSKTVVLQPPTTSPTLDFEIRHTKSPPPPKKKLLARGEDDTHRRAFIFGAAPVLTARSCLSLHHTQNYC